MTSFFSTELGVQYLLDRAYLLLFLLRYIIFFKELRVFFFYEVFIVKFMFQLPPPPKLKMCLIWSINFGHFPNRVILK